MHTNLLVRFGSVTTHQLVYRLRKAQWHPLWRAGLPVLVFALAYLAAANAGALLSLPIREPSQPVPSPLFLPGAVFISALLFAPVRHWWLYVAVTFPLHLSMAWALHLPLSVLLLSFIANTLLGIGTVSLLRRLVVSPLRFAGVQEVSLFVSSVFAGALVPACIGAAGRHFFLGQSYWVAWQAWFLGDVLANLVFVPAIVLWVSAGWRGLRPATRARMREAVVLSTALVVMSVLVLGVHLEGPDTAPVLICLSVPVLLWAGVRFGPRGLTGTLALFTLFAIWGIASASGPFIGRPMPARVFALQLFLSVIGIPLFFLAALGQERERAEVALRASEERYRTVVELQTELVSRSLPDTTLTFLNDAHCRHLGKAPGELLGVKWLDLVPAAERPRVAAALQELLAHPGVLTIEHEAELPDGSRRWQQWVNRTICDADGQVRELQSVGRDITERKQVEAELERLTIRLLRAEDEERRRIAQDLHDGTAQTLVAVNLNLLHLRQLCGHGDHGGNSCHPTQPAAAAAAEDAEDGQPVAGGESVAHVLADSQALVQQALQEIRALSYLLHPPRLEETGLVATLGAYAQGFSARSGIRVQVVVPTPLGRLPAKVEAALFRIVQEGLSNVHRHSGSRSARIQVTKRGQSVRLQLQDRGRGMRRCEQGSTGDAGGAGDDAGAAASGGGVAAGGEAARGGAAAGGIEAPWVASYIWGVGILEMRQRLRQLGGQLEIQSSPQGTTLTAIVPVAP
jgi:PAS domain S-box-containing protein